MVSFRAKLLFARGGKFEMVNSGSQLPAIQFARCKRGAYNLCPVVLVAYVRYLYRPYNHGLTRYNGLYQHYFLAWGIDSIWHWYNNVYLFSFSSEEIAIKYQIGYSLKHHWLVISGSWMFISFYCAFLNTVVNNFIWINAN